MEFIAGMSYSALGSSLPDLSQLLDLTKSEASLFPVVHFTGALFALVLIGSMVPNARVVLSGASILMAISSLGISLIPPYSTCVFLFFFFGLSSYALAVLPGIMVSSLKNGKAAVNMNILFGFFSVGVMAAPLVSGLVSFLGYHYPPLFICMAVLCLLACFMTIFAHLPTLELERALSPGKIRDLLVQFPVYFLVVVLMYFLYVGAESIPNIWIPQYFTDTFIGFGEFRSRLVLSLFWAAIALGRYACASILKRGAKPRVVLAVLAIMAAIWLMAAGWAKSRLAAELILISSGLFFSAMFPIIISFVDRLEVRLTGTMFILVIMSGTVGGSIASRTVGFVADAFGLRLGIMLGAIPLISIFFLTIWMRKHIGSG